MNEELPIYLLKSSYGTYQVYTKLQSALLGKRHNPMFKRNSTLHILTKDGFLYSVTHDGTLLSERSGSTRGHVSDYDSRVKKEWVLK